MRWLVDGMNVLGSRPDGWWRDRDGAVHRLLVQLQRFAAGGETVTLVLDGRPPPGLAEGEHGGVAVRYALHAGRGGADDRIVAEAAKDHRWQVVTSDRDLRARVTALGATVEGASAFLARLPETS